jgi:hypothetical protein
MLRDARSHTPPQHKVVPTKHRIRSSQEFRRLTPDSLQRDAAYLTILAVCVCSTCIFVDDKIASLFFIASVVHSLRAYTLALNEAHHNP